MMQRILAPLASLKLTVVLMALAIVLIFIGTLAQAHLGVWQAVEQYFRSPIAWVDLQIVFSSQSVPAWLIPIPGGLTLGGLMLLNLLAAHLVRFSFSPQRLGIIVLHAGLAVLLVGELVTYLCAREGLMSITEGQSATYIEDIRRVELALVDTSAPAQDQVWSIPQRRLQDAHAQGGTIKLPGTPLELDVVEWMPNAELLERKTEDSSIMGFGRQFMAQRVAQVAGADGGGSDSPAALVRLHHTGRTAGTWLVAAGLQEPQSFTLDGHELQLTLRYQRTYQPYRVHLLEFRHDKFVGTEIARNFSSRVRIEDPAQGTDREVVISMNQPLRYRGDTLYQASYQPDNRGTILQVVRNPGWLLPYLACVLVTVGMVYHFGWQVSKFTRQRQPATAKTVPLEVPVKARFRGLVVCSTLLVMGVIIGIPLARRPGATAFDLAGFAALPVSSEGRVKPMDSVARNALMLASGRQTLRMDKRELSATEFMLELMARPQIIKEVPLVRVDHPEVLTLLGHKPEAVGRISLAVLETHWPQVLRQAQQAEQTPSKQRDAYQRAIMALYDRVNMLLAHARLLTPYVAAPRHPGDTWQMFHEALQEAGPMIGSPHTATSQPRGPVHPSVAYFNAMMSAYIQQDAPRFNRAVHDYHGWLQAQLPSETRRAAWEVIFNQLTPFMTAIMLYVLAFVLASVNLLIQSRHSSATAPHRGSRFRGLLLTLLWGTFALHTLAILARMYFQERPPVTNLYSSAVFVGWAAVLFCLWLERYYALGVALLGAALTGFVTLVVAHNLGNDGDTMQMMQAVLDSNFWLSTHVVTITLGYSATFVAGILATFYLVLGVFTRYLDAARAQALARMIYGVVCFALLLSFVGTVLGGIWADQSWGRFWGWDPKENGAALVVLMNAIILHAHWAGWIKQRGIVNLAIAGNIVTAWSWFGTNMLGVGLHSYGFMSSAVMWMLIYVLSQLLLIALGLLPTVLWRSRLASGQYERDEKLNLPKCS